MAASIRPTLSASRAGTPEQYFQPKPNPEKEIPVDALICALDRALAVLAFIQDNGSSTKDGFTINDAVLSDALWCVEGVLEQAVAMVRHPHGLEV